MQPFQASGEENNKPLWQKKHNNFLKKKTGDYVDSMTMAMKNLGKNNEEILAKPSPRLEEKRSQPRKPTLHTQRASLKPRHQKDYLNQNKAKIIGAMPTSRVGDSDNSPYKHKSHGQIPDYLKKRKQTWEEEVRRIVWRDYENEVKQSETEASPPARLNKQQKWYSNLPPLPPILARRKFAS